MWQGSKVIFEGEDFRPSLGSDPVKALYQIAGWLTMRPGDTDEESFSFADYTADQMAFCQSDDCEYMRMLDYEDSEDPLKFDRVYTY